MKLTRDEILNMPAGREMDALVAEKFFGWTWQGNEKVRMLVPPDDHPASINNWAAEWDECGCPNWLPEYSESISCAWDVVKHVEKLDWSIMVRHIRNYEKKKVFEAYIDDPNSDKVYIAEAETVPVAFIRAALLAVMEAE